MRIILCVSNDLTADQRVHKMAVSLQELNAEILIIGRKHKKSTKLKARTYKTRRFRLIFNKKALFYAELNIRLFFYLLFHKYKIAVANDADTLLAVYWASKIKKREMVFDSHEIFSEVPELSNRPKIKQIWQAIENKYIPKLKNCITVCDSIAHYYLKKYNTKFVVIPNLPLEQKITPKTRADFNLPNNSKILIYQGAINKARGIELMIDSLKYLENWILVIAGKGDIENELKNKISQQNLSSKVYFMGQLDFDTLKSLTALADIGLSLEEDMGLNYRFALPNKLFDYTHAEIPVIVSNLPEMKKWVKATQVGEVLRIRSPKNLAILINKVYQKSENKFWDFYINNTFSQLFWSNNQKKLHNIYKKLIL